jgi:hypothetical protein
MLTLNNVQDYDVRMLVIRFVEIINISTYRICVIVIKKAAGQKPRPAAVITMILLRNKKVQKSPVCPCPVQTIGQERQGT